MKILKYILYGIVLLVLLYLSFGLFNPSVSYGHEIKVDKPLKEAWAVTQDEAKYPEWLEGFQSMELISGERMKAGSKYKIIVNPGNGQPDFEMIETLNEIKEFEYVDMHFDSDFMDFEQKMIFSEVDGKTSVRSDSKVIGKNIFTRSMFSIMEMFGGAFQKQEAKNMEALKKVIEKNTTDYFPAPVVETEEVEIEEG